MVHLIIVPAHFSHAPAHGILFSAIGVGQILWATAFCRFSFSKPLYSVGLALTGGIVVLWCLTQIVSVPFASTPEPIDWSALISKILESIGFLTLLLSNLIHQSTVRIEPKLKLIAVSVVLALIAGVAVWGSGHLAEVLFPKLGHVRQHEHEHRAVEENGHDGAPHH